MSTLLAIDPSIVTSGVAVFRSGLLTYCTLADCRFLRADSLYSRVAAMADEIWYVAGMYGATEVVCELPQIYTASTSKKNDTALIPIFLLTGFLMCCADGTPVSDFKTVQPRQWKGQQPKEVTRHRVLQRLSQAEKEALDLGLIRVPKSLQHNVFDAVGIGLHSVGRY